MPECSTDDDRADQGADPFMDAAENADVVRQQSERLTAVALAYQAEQRAKGRDISLTTAIIEIITQKDQ
jgi:hypothetical protein